MSYRPHLLAAALFLSCLSHTPAGVLYVDLNCPTPALPYSNWVTAATSIQDAIDAAGPSDTVLVTNGVYQTGGRVVNGALTNRVVVDKPITLQSVNGPAVTFIEGWQVPGTVNGDGAVRCMYLADGAFLSGFTLTNGATGVAGLRDFDLSGGGALCQSTNAVLSNCVVIANSCYGWGAGVYSGTLIDCDVVANTNRNGSLGGGGGAAYSRLSGSKLNGNRTNPSDGGGALACYLTNCVVTGNYDVGAGKCTLDYCVVTANNGTGVSGGVVNNCMISSNAPVPGLNTYGGGAVGASLTNCVLYGNQATNGGGVFNCSLSHCILSNNWAARSGGAIYVDGSFTNAINDCIISGNAAGDTGGGFFCLAAYAGLVINRCTFSRNTATNNGAGMAFQGGYIGKVTECTVDGNRAGASGGGLYVAVSMSGGVISNCSFCANVANTSGGGVYNAVLGQCAIVGNQAGKGGGACQGTLTGCNLSTNSALFAGGGTWNTTLEFCVLDGNQAGVGGGVYNGSAMACTLLNNAAVTNGGGACSATLQNSLLRSNSANAGGGAYGGSLDNCTVVGNAATNSGGGVSSASSVINSIVCYNTAPGSSNYSSSSFTAGCTMPLPPGAGNISNAPVFVDMAKGNFRLQTNSPCINRGNNSYALAVDLDGRPRIVGGTVDMGAYEFHGAGTGEFTAWLQQYGLATDGSADFLDSDLDGLNNWQEWIAGTIPTNALSVLRLLSPTADNSGITVSWQSVQGKTYYLQRGTDLATSPALLSIQSNLVGQTGTTSFKDTDATNASAYFYRVGVQQ